MPVPYCDPNTSVLPTKQELAQELKQVSFRAMCGEVAFYHHHPIPISCSIRLGCEIQPANANLQGFSVSTIMHILPGEAELSPSQS